jgi:hypothetical protein
MPRLKLGVLQQHRIHLLMEAIPGLLVGRDLEVRKMLCHRSFPLGQLFIAAVETQVEREAHRPTDVEARDRVMGQGIGALSMVVVAVHVVEEAAYVFTERIIQDDE